MQQTLRFAWWSPEQASETLGCTPDHVRWLCREGKLTARLERRRWWIDPASVARYLDRRRSEEGVARGS